MRPEIARANAGVLVDIVGVGYDGARLNGIWSSQLFLAAIFMISIPRSIRSLFTNAMFIIGRISLTEPKAS